MQGENKHGVLPRGTKLCQSWDESNAKQKIVPIPEKRPQSPTQGISRYYHD